MRMLSTPQAVVPIVFGTTLYSGGQFLVALSAVADGM
jgi:hypothetical protein